MLDLMTMKDHLYRLPGPEIGGAPTWRLRWGWDLSVLYAARVRTRETRRSEFDQ